MVSGDPVDEISERGQKPLLVAVWNNGVGAARLLIEAGAEGRVEILRLILERGADLESTNRFGGTALIPAAEEGHPEAVALLIAAGVDVDHVNNLGWTALLEAVILTDGGPNAQRIVQQLLEAGADRTIPDSQGRTALEHARARGLGEMVEMLEAK